MFNIHHDLLCYQSKYFHKALKEELFSIENGPYSLSTTSAVMFRSFLDWLYIEKLALAEVLNMDFSLNRR